MVEAVEGSSTALIQCPTSSNIYLPDFFIDSLERRYTGAWKEQECGGQFVDFGQNRAYQEYKPKLNAAHNVRRDFYNPAADLALCMDFNVALMAWPVTQVHPSLDSRQPMAQPVVLTEIHEDEGGRFSIPRQCARFRREFPDHRGLVVIHGDATGSGGSAQTGYSAYDLVDNELRGHYDIQFLVPRSNPRKRNRILTTNDGLRGTGLWNPLLIDVDECPILIRDLESCVMDEKGEDVEKIRDAQDERYFLTHASDALGYWLSMEVPTSSLNIDGILANVRHENRGGGTVVTSNFDGRDPRPHGSGLEGLDL